jgi:uncharacterized protein
VIGVKHMVEQLIEYIVKHLVTQPTAVEVTGMDTPEKYVVQIRVAQSDIARVIGSEGRILRALRTLAVAVGTPVDKDIVVDVLR